MDENGRNNHIKPLLIFGVIALAIVGVYSIKTIVDLPEIDESPLVIDDNGSVVAEAEDEDIELNQVQRAIAASFTTNLSKDSVEDWTKIVSGGVPKDGIPAINDPKFIAITETEIPADTEGLYLELGGDKRFYPYNILVRHEIVNDVVDGKPVSVTFCPLCGSGIAFSRELNGQILDFGVSGFLRESNMIMYDRQTESLWQQALGESFAGELNGSRLEFIPAQLTTVGDIAASHPDAKIMSTDTGVYSASSYSGTPYGNYDEDNDYFLFQPSSVDARFPSKEIFQIVVADDYSVAVRRSELDLNSSYNYVKNDISFTIKTDEKGLITAFDARDNILPSYFEMWFSWAVQHKDSDKALIWEPSTLNL